MAAPDSEDRPSSATADHQAPRVLKLRIVPWDVVSTVAVSALLLYLVTATSWPARLFAFTDNVCLTEDCPPVPYGANYYIYPVMWGGIGAAIAAAVIGPFVSMVKGWYMSFWPIIAVGVITITSVLGYALAGFSERFWH
ncbi:hypothetical protein [Mycobacterium attenuatum]|uniref:Uncharacterized protein n=1 Tax=Mycobacterium attenuatum TaxID=2341086 RepID=A0A498Q3K2_9MYCO|nr:hypothetical protein [Mycobacterium attenuatum]VBA38410.1 hypothetical protein LAUMK136_02456 [Mycobacterium attenuatum]VBA52436.1 hypothetical protein LAUMK191_02460 [Mycobacterium attenuatum]VBA57585.1 hypothetical protein LAUMK41_02545 [Mycobacterium attenuatum]